MYYEERWIDGKFCWRTSPDGAWTAYTANELAHRYQAELQRAHDLQRALDVEREKVRELEQEGLQLFEWRLALHSLTPGGSEFCTPDACESWVRKSRASQHEYIIEQIKQRKELQAQLATLQAQLRRVEGDRQTLRQLVAALPVVDVQEVSVWLSPDESGWFVSKRPAFPAGLYWAKFRTQAEADSFRALLAYRATLAAKDAGKAVSSG